VKLFFTIIGVYLLLFVSFWAAVGFVVYHYLSKTW